ncbi:MAG: hypothetical protein JRM80_02835 [Nitrososphaerota archaeon]|nr:hypothetical protein [Nitrososphaerota archaeon]
MLEPYEKSLIRGSYRLARRGLRKSKETAKEQALRMFVGWARKNSGKDVSEARVREARAYLDELIGAEE